MINPDSYFNYLSTLGLAQGRCIMGSGSSRLTPDEQQDLIKELKKLIAETNLAVDLQVRDIGPSPKSCPGCIACTCMICI